LQDAQIVQGGRYFAGMPMAGAIAISFYVL
jgi:hypothetical protein